MIDRIELSKSDRAKCRRCRKKIGLKTSRGVEVIYKFNHPETYYYCYKCAERGIEEDIKFSQKLKRELKKMVKKNQSAIVLQELK